MTPFQRVKEFGYILTSEYLVIFCDVKGSKLSLVYRSLIEELASLRGSEIDIEAFFSGRRIGSDIKSFVESTLCESIMDSPPIITRLVFHGNTHTAEVECAKIVLDKMVERNQETQLLAKGHQACLHLIHSRYVEVDRFDGFENSCDDGDLVFTSTFIDKYHVLFGPTIRRKNTPSFRDFFENWVIHENASLNTIKPWSKIMEYFDTSSRMMLGCVEISRPLEGLVAFSLLRTLRMYIENRPGIFYWDEAFGVVYCDLTSGQICHDNVIHGVS